MFTCDVSLCPSVATALSVFPNEGQGSTVSVETTLKAAARTRSHFIVTFFLILHFNCGFDSTVLRRKVTPCKKKGVPKWALCVVCTTNKVLLWLTAGVIVSWWLWLHQMTIYIDKTYIYIPYISLLGMALYHGLFQMYSRESVDSLWLFNRC